MFPGGLKKIAKFGIKSSDVPTFHISVFLRGFLLTSSDLRERGKLWQLGDMLFGKSLGCTSKLCNRLPAWLCLKREIKGLFLKFWWEACLKLCFFFSRTFGIRVFLAPIELRNPKIWFEFKKFNFWIRHRAGTLQGPLRRLNGLI